MKGFLKWLFFMVMPGFVLMLYLNACQYLYVRQKQMPGRIEVQPDGSWKSVPK